MHLPVYFTKVKKFPATGGRIMQHQRHVYPMEYIMGTKSRSGKLVNCHLALQYYVGYTFNFKWTYYKTIRISACIPITNKL
jgi:hypothetical protein